ncbi:MAG: DNA mismatch repair endonuclease MutH [Gammaproteobacteria bacterium]
MREGVFRKAPQDERELLERAQILAGKSLSAVAHQLGRRIPPNLMGHKGWVGELLESALGASAGSAPEPDFPAFGVELKTLPVTRDGRPRESTYVCTVPLIDNVGALWETSLVHRKLRRVLWVPIEAEPSISLPVRRIGTALLWSPSAQQDLCLRHDWEELMDLICMGEFDQLRAHRGDCLQVRPKAANGRSLTEAIGPAGERIQTLPRGFYLRPSFTAAILREHFGIVT